MSTTDNVYWSIGELLKNSSYIGVPHFQRGYVWNEANISALLESLYFNTPCGNIVLWEIPNMVKSEDYGVPLTAKNSQNKITQFIIDGQQRTRSLLYVFYPDEDMREEEDNANDESAEESSDSNKSIPYVWAVNLARFAEKVLKQDDGSYKYTGLLDFPSNNPEALFVKVRDPYEQKIKYIEHAKDKRQRFWGNKNEEGKAKRLNFSPEYRCQYNFVPLSFFFNCIIDDDGKHVVSINKNKEFSFFKCDCPQSNYRDEKYKITEPSANDIFVKYKGGENADTLTGLLNALRDELAKMLTRQLAVRTINTNDYSDVIHTFIRINSGGKAVQEEEKTLARLVQLSPEKTDYEFKTGAFSVLKSLFQKIHPEKKGEINEHFQRLKENRFGFRLFIRVFVLAANYHTGKAMGTQAMSFSAIQNNERLESEEGKEKIPEIWDCVKSVTMAVYYLLTEDLHFDTLAFLPDSRSLRPVFMLLIKYPKFMKKDKIKDVYKPYMAYILLSLLLGAGDSEIDIMNFVTQIRNSPLDGSSLLKLLTTDPREEITVDKISKIAGLGENDDLEKFIKATFLEDCKALMTIWEKIRNAGNQGSLKDNLNNKFKNVNALTNRYILLLYVLERHLGAVDFYGGSLTNIRDENGKELDFSRFMNSKREIRANMEYVCGQTQNPPEKQHIVPYYWLHPESEGRKSNDYANNIGNITYISRKLNHYETGLGKYWLNLQDADNDLLRGHIISPEAKDLYTQMTPNTTISIEKDSDFDKWVKQRQKDIANAFYVWVKELRAKAKVLEEALFEKIPHARRLILPPNESSKEKKLIVQKFQWTDIMTEVWQWSELDDKQKLLVAALHNQSQCYIKLTENEKHELFMREPGKKVASKVGSKESEKTDQIDAKKIISEALNRFRYDKKEKKQ